MIHTRQGSWKQVVPWRTCLWLALGMWGAQASFGEAAMGQLASLAHMNGDTRDRMIYTVCPDGSGDFYSIQPAIEAASSGDIIELCDGHFFGDNNKNLDFMGKAITVRSATGDAEACIIECESNGRGVWFQGAEGPETVLENVTIKDGVATGSLYGGGIHITGGSSPTIRGVQIVNCRPGTGPESYGGGAYVASTGSPVFIDCVFLQNEARTGGAVTCILGQVTFANCTFCWNHATNGGAGARVQGSGTTATFYGCTFQRNSGDNHAGGVQTAYGGHAALENCIITYSWEGEAVHCGTPPYNGSMSFECCDFFGNAGGDWVDCATGHLGINGNISEDPGYCDPDACQLYIREFSPCAPFTPPNPECTLIGAWPVGCSEITVLYPNGGQTIIVGEPVQILWGWMELCGPNVSIELLRDGEVCAVITASTENNGEYTWLAERCAGESEGYQIRVTCLDLMAYDDSDGTFEMLWDYCVLSVEDVGNDQGRWVRIRWSRCEYDQPGQPTITGYEIYREQDQYLLNGLDPSVSGAGQIDPPAGQRLDGWDYLGTTPAHGDEVYQWVAPTLCDSTISQGLCLSTFFVRAVTPDPFEYYDTDPASGYSVDNLAPGVPTDVDWLDPGLEMVWDEALDEDFAYYTVYGSDAYIFDPQTAEFIDSTIEPYANVSQYQYGYYHVTATDFAGNESWASTTLLHPMDVEVASSEIPGDLLLHQNRPNPMASRTTISFELPQATSVRLCVLDACGRVVCNLVNDHLEPGVYRVSWDGIDAGGREVGSGVYFCQLTTAGRSLTRRLMVYK